MIRVGASGHPRRRRNDLIHTPFFQPREPAFWLYVAVVVVTGAISLGQQSLYRRLSLGGWALSWSLLLLYALPVFLVVYYLDLYEREPLPLVFAALVWGAVAATTLSAFANEGWGLVVARVGGAEFAARWTAALTAPVVEETLKGLGVVLIYLIARDEVDDAMDGFVYGAVCGLGFAVVEDVFYFMSVFGGRPPEVLRGFFVRVVAGGLYSHVLYTGLVGMGIGYVVSRRDTSLLTHRLRICAGLCVAAVLGHFIWNSPLLDFFPPEPWTAGDRPAVFLATAVKGLPLLAFVALAVRLARGRERRWLASALSTEVALGGISAAELGALEEPRVRRSARREMRRRAGPRAASLMHRLQREQVNLAMIRSRVATDDDPAMVRQRAHCRSLRDALEAMPGAAPADSGPGTGPGAGAGPPDREG
jgi:RsiW-degrading membrane proteinase PrsW (M82 family)